MDGLNIKSNARARLAMGVSHLHTVTAEYRWWLAVWIFVLFSFKFLFNTGRAERRQCCTQYPSRSWVRLRPRHYSGNNPGQVVHTWRASVHQAV